MTEEERQRRRFKFVLLDFLLACPCIGLAAAIVMVCLRPVTRAEQTDAALLEITSVLGLRFWAASLVLGPLVGLTIALLDGRRWRWLGVGTLIGVTVFGAALLAWLLRVWR
jgi:hypothetical protein